MGYFVKTIRGKMQVMEHSFTQDEVEAILLDYVHKSRGVNSEYLESFFRREKGQFIVVQVKPLVDGVLDCAPQEECT